MELRNGKQRCGASSQSTATCQSTAACRQACSPGPPCHARVLADYRMRCRGMKQSTAGSCALARTKNATAGSSFRRAAQPCGTRQPRGCATRLLASMFGSSLSNRKGTCDTQLQCSRRAKKSPGSQGASALRHRLKVGEVVVIAVSCLVVATLCSQARGGRQIEGRGQGRAKRYAIRQARKPGWSQWRASWERGPCCACRGSQCWLRVATPRSKHAPPTCQGAGRRWQAALRADNTLAHPTQRQPNRAGSTQHTRAAGSSPSSSDRSPPRSAGQEGPKGREGA